MTPARKRALFVLCLALTVVVIDNTILAVAFPSIQRGLDTDESGLQWIGSSYGLVLAGLLLPLAVIGDRHGRKRMLMIGLTIFGVASVAGAFADSAATLTVARGLMGIGGACAMPATLVHDRQRLSRRGTRSGDRGVVRGRRHRHRGRSRHRRAVARALLVGLGVPRQRARRAGHARPRRVVGPGVA